MSDILGLLQVKLPVTNLARSVDFYTRLLDLRLWVEIVEQGTLRGVGLIDRDGRYNISLRNREVCASTPDLTGFDVVAFRPTDRAALVRLAARCAAEGFTHGGVVDGPTGAVLDVTDPDGTVLRFYHFTAPTDGFTGVVFGDGGVETGHYSEPRLTAQAP
ncbi:VOC family protein [Paractinoplanes globisporus]|uniref:VOC family protein n=1 Tax=Paractinoplanes globisporus TaxID=113565 RepID=A0ABW6WIC3_9ACTN|nr:VOC family protein [Actinoplanes globisporus]